MRDQARSGTYLAIVLVVAGFVVIVLGWYGAARLDRVPGQIPYLLSGGFSGLGLILAGLTLLVVQQGRRDRAELGAKLDALLDAVRRQSVVAAIGNGTETPHGSAAGDGSQVVLGRSVYHDTSCRLVEGRTGLERATPAAAAGRGLDPCRVCKPAAATAKT